MSIPSCSAINGLEFDDYGDLYFLTSGSTNGGVKGALSGSQLLKDNVLSGALMVAHVSEPDFDGVITYDADDDGNQVGALGSVEVFATGLRNSYDFLFHTNGQIYATDNGSNEGYVSAFLDGCFCAPSLVATARPTHISVFILMLFLQGDMSKSCTESIPDIEEEDKLNLIVQGGYYGFPNRKRGDIDARQCVWRSAHEASDADYTAPLAILPASSNGIVEFESEAFEGQLRGDLIGKLSFFLCTVHFARLPNVPYLSYHLTLICGYLVY